MRASRSRSRTFPPRLLGTRDAAFWRRLANCESSDGRNSADGLYHGYFQFLISTWRALGAPGVPEDYGYAVQRYWAQRLAQVADPYHQWPVCWPRALGSGS